MAKINVMKEIEKYDVNKVYSYKDVDRLLEKLCDDKLGYLVDFIVIEGSLVDSYLIDIGDYNENFRYALFLEKYLNAWSSGNVLIYIKDDEELKEKFSFIVEEINRMNEEE